MYAHACGIDARIGRIDRLEVQPRMGRISLEEPVGFFRLLLDRLRQGVK